MERLKNKTSRKRKKVKQYAEAPEELKPYVLYYSMRKDVKLRAESAISNILKSQGFTRQEIGIELRLIRSAFNSWKNIQDKSFESWKDLY